MLRAHNASTVMVVKPEGGADDTAGADGVGEGDGDARVSVTAPGTINALEVLLVLALFCQAESAEAQLRLAFTIFDVDRSGSLEKVCTWSRSQPLPTATNQHSLPH